MADSRADEIIRRQEKMFGDRTIFEQHWREIAERMYQRHLVLAKFLVRLGVREETAFADACRMEHDISAETFSAISRHAEKSWE